MYVCMYYTQREYEAASLAANGGNGSDEKRRCREGLPWGRGRGWASPSSPTPEARRRPLPPSFLPSESLPRCWHGVGNGRAEAAGARASISVDGAKPSISSGRPLGWHGAGPPWRPRSKKPLADLGAPWPPPDRLARSPSLFSCLLLSCDEGRGGERVRKRADGGHGRRRGPRKECGAVGGGAGRCGEGRGGEGFSRDWNGSGAERTGLLSFPFGAWGGPRKFNFWWAYE
jgi:hypothetical protein